KVKY
ncbi:hypothetical protein BN1723_008200, partial [Verticillium longisporum]